MNIIPTDSTSIYSILSTLAVRDSQVVLVRPGNPPPGIAGFLLDLAEEDTSELESDITDHYIENNTAIQDHIALRPETITVTGRVAELVKTVPTVRPISPVPNTMPDIPEMQPEFTDEQQLDQDEVATTTAQDAAAVASSASLFGYYQDQAKQQPGQTKQSYIYNFFYQLWKGRQLFSVESPWGIMENMAIQSASAKQGAESRSVTEFTITFKKIRVARAITINAGLLTGRRTGGDQFTPSVNSAFAGRAQQMQSTEVRSGIVGALQPTATQLANFNGYWPTL
jgi:hypothetical protein